MLLIALDGTPSGRALRLYSDSNNRVPGSRGQAFARLNHPQFGAANCLAAVTHGDGLAVDELTVAAIGVRLARAEIGPVAALIDAAVVALGLGRSESFHARSVRLFCSRSGYFLLGSNPLNGWKSDSGP